MKFLFNPGSQQSKDLALLVIRVGLGLVFIKHGYPKIMGGKEEWLWLGQAMQNFGITTAPLYWGFMAALSESLGGVLILIGLATRPAAFLLACTMFVAAVMHIAKGDPWGYISHPLALCVVFVGLMVAGAGSYSLDAYLSR